MSEAPRPQPVQVVIAFDFTPSSEVALLHGIDLATTAPHHVLHIVTALDTRARTVLTAETSLASVGADEVQAMILDRVKDLVSGRKSAAEVEVFAYARLGHSAPEILALAREVGAELILIGSHGSTGIERVLLGSVSEHVVREAKCPVLVARAKQYPAVQRLRVFRYDHERTPYHPPHRYTHPNLSVTTHADEWPSS